MKLTIIGSGNVATHLGLALRAAGHEIGQVYSRDLEHARQLAVRLDAMPTDDIGTLSTDVEVWLFAVKDDALALLANDIKQRRALNLRLPIMIHTSGSTPQAVFQNVASRYGVLYPLQTFSKERAVDFHSIPCFIEGSDNETESVVCTLADSISERVVQMDSTQRRLMHLAAVWACNFVNHCYDVADGIMQQCNLPFSLLLPLIDETARKVHDLSPRQAQTGPAVRYDRSIIDKHMQLLSGQPQLAKLYEKMSQSIRDKADELE